MSVRTGVRGMQDAPKVESHIYYHRFMKTTTDIRDDELRNAMCFTRAKTKREGVVTTIVDFNRRRRMADLVKYAGTCRDFVTVEELQAQRRKQIETCEWSTWRPEEARTSRLRGRASRPADG